MDKKGLIELRGHVGSTTGLKRVQQHTLPLIEKAVSFDTIKHVELKTRKQASLIH